VRWQVWTVRLVLPAVALPGLAFQLVTQLHAAVYRGGTSWRAMGQQTVAFAFQARQRRPISQDSSGILWEQHRCFTGLPPSGRPQKTLNALFVGTDSRTPWNQQPPTCFVPLWDGCGSRNGRAYLLARIIGPTDRMVLAERSRERGYKAIQDC
jgi:hypothetical protein